MKKRNTLVVVIIFLSLFFGQMSWAQKNTYQSVLSEHTWYRLSVTK